MAGQGLLREILEGDALSEREVEALEGAALGETAAATGARLYLSAETVKCHRKRALAKLGAPSITRAVVLAAASGILSVERLAKETTAP